MAITLKAVYVTSNGATFDTLQDAENVENNLQFERGVALCIKDSGWVIGCERDAVDWIAKHIKNINKFTTLNAYGLPYYCYPIAEELVQNIVLARQLPKINEGIYNIALNSRIEAIQAFCGYFTPALSVVKAKNYVERHIEYVCENSIASATTAAAVNTADKAF